jgi:hypothetical protein
MADIQNCAGTSVVSSEQRTAGFLDLQTAIIAIRIGQPLELTSPAYQIGSEDILVIVNLQNPVGALTADQVRALFTGQITNWQAINNTNASVQVWVFASGEDIQDVFEKAIQGESPVTPNARLASSPDEMSQAVANDVNAVGILTRHWKAGNVSEVYSLANIPVLAISAGEPQGIVQGILACLQN